MIYRFLEDGSRCVIAEDKDAGFAVAPPVSSGLGANSASRARRNTRSLAIFVRSTRRFGIGINTDHTLGEVGQQFSLTRERIRQVTSKEKAELLFKQERLSGGPSSIPEYEQRAPEAKALRKLKHPSRSRVLRSFLDK
jgi:hypothetical protein